MKSVLKCIGCILSIIWLVACGASPSATIPPSPIPINISLSPALDPARQAIEMCAGQLDHTAVFIDSIPASVQDYKSGDLIIWWGEKPEEIEYAYPLAEDELVIIINPENPNKELKATEVKSIFSGRIEAWSQISIFNQPISVWIFPPGNDISETFRSAILDIQPYGRLARLALTPQAMVEAIAADAGGIGYLPRSWLQPNVSASMIDENLQMILRKPVLALAAEKPQGEVLELLSCLQSGAGQEKLMESFSPSG